MNEQEAARQFRLALMQLAAAVAPMREWLAGELHYFRSQGYNDREAHATAAVTYCTVFGAKMYGRKLEMLVAAGRRALDERYHAEGPLFDSCGCGGPGPRPRTLADAKTALGRRRADRRAPAQRARTRIPRRWPR